MLLGHMSSLNELFLAQLGSCSPNYTFNRPRQCLAAAFADFHFIQPLLKSIPYNTVKSTQAL